MKSIHGKLCALVVLVNAHVFAQEMVLELATTDGDKLDQALVGQPFLARVTIAPATSSYSQPELSHSDHLQVRPAGFHMQSINGASEITYNYRVYADAEGVFKIGPARLTTQQQSLVSNDVSVTVVPFAHNQSVKSKHEKAFMRLVCDKKEVVVGEKVRCALRFYTSSKRIQLRHVGEPEIDHCPYSTYKKQGPTRGVETIDGTAYDYHEWTWELYPQQEGACLIPAYYADYSMPNKKNDLFSMFTSVFPTVNEQKRVYSNGLSLNVKKMPPTKTGAQAVGTFQSFKAQVESHALKQGEGTVLTLELIGDADLENIKQLPLHDVPSGLRWYESKQHIVSIDANNQKKLFEYIIQATQAGDWEIPSQQFVYFDTNKRSYKTLKTLPLTLHVIAVSGSKEKPVKQENTTTVEHQSPPSSIHDEDVFEIAQGPWAASQQMIIPWLYLLIACLMSGSGVLLYALKTLKSDRSPASYTRAQLHKLIDKARKNNDYAALYCLMRGWLLARPGSAENDSLEQMVESLAKRNEVSYEKQQQWQQFWNQLSEVQFGARPGLDNGFSLFDAALHWIDFWEELT